MPFISVLLYWVGLTEHEAKCVDARWFAHIHSILWHLGESNNFGPLRAYSCLNMCDTAISGRFVCFGVFSLCKSLALQ